MRRYFVRTAGGVVDEVLEIDGEGAASATPPDGMTEVTDHPEVGQGIEHKQLLLRPFDAQQKTFGDKLSEAAADALMHPKIEAPAEPLEAPTAPEAPESEV